MVSILSLSILGSLFLSFLYRISGSRILILKESDFLSAFPSFSISKLFGRENILFEGSLAQKWMGQKDWNYGPFHQMLTIPLYFYTSIYAITTFLFFFLLLIYLGTVLSIYQAATQYKMNRKLLVLLIGILVINYPFLSALQQRNLEILELFLVMAAMISYQRKNYTLAGIFVGLATGIKFLPAIIVMQFLVSRNWKAISGFLYVIVPQLILAQLFLGWQHSFTIRLLIHGESGTIPLRQGLNDVILRLSNGSNNVLYELIYLAIVIIAFLFGIASLRKCLQQTLEESDHWRVWSILLASICLLAPHANNYYFVLLSPLIIQLYLLLIRERIGGYHILFGLGLFLISLPLPFAVLWRIVPSNMSGAWKSTLLNFQSFSPIFFGSLILVCIGLKRYKSLLLLNVIAKA